MSKQAILNIANRAKPEIIGICSTGVTETKGDDVDGFIKLIRANHPELADIGSGLCLDARFQGRISGRLGARPSTRMVEALVEPADGRRARPRESTCCPAAI